MFRKVLIPSLVLGLVLLASPGLALPPDVPLGQGWQAGLIAQGWQPVTDGVLQRSLGGNKVETLAVGREGFEWMLQRQEDRLGFFVEEYERYPSEKLRELILDLGRDIAEAEATLQEQSLGSEPMALAEPVGGGETIENCDISYGAHADAYPLTGSSAPGVGATASSYFNNNCFYWGRVDASVYVRATQGGVTTSDSAAQTQEGENISASAALTRGGVEDCYSNAWARSMSDGLGIIYETSDFNDDCPVPTLTATISGPLSVFISGYTCRLVTWNASVSGGVSPYTYNWYWDGYLVGTGSSFSEYFCGDNWTWTEYVYLSLTVRDSVGSTASDTHTTRINYSGSGCTTKICPEPL
jgi:hypothetical protein